MPHQHHTSRPPVDRSLFPRRPLERPLYPVAVLGDDELDQPTEVVRFAGFPFARVGGEWRLVDHADVAIRETDD